MILLAISTGMAILSLIGLAAGAAVLVVVVALFNRVVHPAIEIDHYAQGILAGGNGIASNLDGVDELARTRELGGVVAELATRYLEQIKRAIR